MIESLLSRLSARDPVTQPLRDTEALISREELILATRQHGRNAIEARLYPAVLDWLWAQSQARWFYPPVEPLEEAWKDLCHASGRLHSSNSAGSTFLQSRFTAFWDVDNGPAKSDKRTLDRVLRYRMGLNNSKLYKYKLSNGEVVECQETFDISPKNVRRGYVVQRKGVSFFKPAVARSLYRQWCPVTPTPIAWDPSCGFGARLLGFAAAFPGGIYLGNEPASAIRRDVMALSQLLKDAGHLTHSYISDAGSEKEELEPESVDIVLTSPPYFNLERWFDEPGQCWKDYPTLTDWTQKYLHPTFKTAYTALRPGCRMIINIDERNRDVTLTTAHAVGFSLEAEQALELGSDHFARSRGQTNARSEPIFVFRK